VFLSLTNFIISDMFSINDGRGCVFSVITLHSTKLYITIIDNYFVVRYTLFRLEIRIVK